MCLDYPLLLRTASAEQPTAVLLKFLTLQIRCPQLHGNNGQWLVMIQDSWEAFEKGLVILGY